MDYAAELKKLIEERSQVMREIDALKERVKTSQNYYWVLTGKVALMQEVVNAQKEAPASE